MKRSRIGFHLFPDIVQNSGTTVGRPCAPTDDAPLNAAKNSPKVFIGNRYRGEKERGDAWNVGFKGMMIDGRGGRRGQVGEKEQEGEGKRESRRRGRGRIKRHKVARSITRRAGPRVIFVRMNKSRSRMRACCKARARKLSVDGEGGRRGRLKRGDGPFIRGRPTFQGNSI